MAFDPSNEQVNQLTKVAVDAGLHSPGNARPPTEWHQGGLLGEPAGVSQPPTADSERHHPDEQGGLPQGRRGAAADLAGERAGPASADRAGRAIGGGVSGDARHRRGGEPAPHCGGRPDSPGRGEERPGGLEQIIHQDDLLSFGWLQGAVAVGTRSRASSCPASTTASRSPCPGAFAGRRKARAGSSASSISSRTIMWSMRGRTARRTRPKRTCACRPRRRASSSRTRRRTRRRPWPRSKSWRRGPRVTRPPSSISRSSS